MRAHAMKYDIRKRIWFWSLFLTLVVGVYIFEIYPEQRIRAEGRQIARLIEQRISTDPRFNAVRAVRATSGAIIVRGVVESDSDIEALRRIVDDASLPRKPVFSVQVSTTPR